MFSWATEEWFFIEFILSAAALAAIVPFWKCVNLRLLTLVDRDENFEPALLFLMYDEVEVGFFASWI